MVVGFVNTRHPFRDWLKVIGAFWIFALLIVWGILTLARG
jgi:hypothetical protein